MALGDPYATATDLQNRLGMTNPSATELTRLSGAVVTASQEVEQFCNRTFNTDADATERKFYASSPSTVFVDDFYGTVSSVQVASLLVGTTATLASTDWETFPATPQMGRPYWALKNTSITGWPVGQPNGHLLVTATWGWQEVPGAVKEATLLMAEEYFKLKDAPFGIVNWGEFGPVRVTINRRAISLLTQFRRGGRKVA